MAGLNTFMYDPRLVQPMREELTRIGFQELRTPVAVDEALTAGHPGRFRVPRLIRAKRRPTD